jgi:hypothetical protein
MIGIGPAPISFKREGLANSPVNKINFRSCMRGTPSRDRIESTGLTCFRLPSETVLLRSFTEIDWLSIISDSIQNNSSSVKTNGCLGKGSGELSGS